MIYFGSFNNKSSRPTRIVNRGAIVFRGSCTIWEGVLLELGPKSLLDIGGSSSLVENVNVMIRKGCKIGNYARIAFDSQIMDSDFHYMLDMETNEIKDCTQPIIIGICNWIGNRSTIKKGTITPVYMIVGANSLLSNNCKI